MNARERDPILLENIVLYCDQICEAAECFGDDPAKPDPALLGTNSVYWNAVSMCILQIGELVGNLSEEFRASHNTIPWREIKGFRNIIAHAYHKVEAALTAEVIRSDIPVLRSVCLAALRDFTGSDVSPEIQRDILAEYRHSTEHPEEYPICSSVDELTEYLKNSDS